MTGTTSDAASSAAGSNAPSSNLIERHQTLVLSVAAFGFTAVKLMSVSHGDMQTVATILTIGGWTSIPSLLITALPYVVAVAAGVSLFDLGERIRERNPSRRLGVAAIILSGLALAIGPRTVVTVGGTGMVAFIIAGLVMRPFIRGKISLGRTTYSVSGHLTFAVLGGLLFAAVSPQPWMPVEKVTAPGVDEAKVYVLGDQGGMTALMSTSERTIRWVSTDEISARVTCPQDAKDRPLLLSLLWSNSSVKGCDE